MALDRALTDAVRAAAREADQPDAVASRLLAWLGKLSDGELSREGNAQFYDELRQSLLIEAGDAN